MEVWESRYPVEFLGYRLVPGLRRRRALPWRTRAPSGDCGVTAPTRLSGISDHHQHGARGVDGGRPGLPEPVPDRARRAPQPIEELFGLPVAARSSRTSARAGRRVRVAPGRWRRLRRRPWSVTRRAWPRILRTATSATPARRPTAHGTAIGERRVDTRRSRDPGGTVVTADRTERADVLVRDGRVRRCRARYARRLRARRLGRGPAGAPRTRRRPLPLQHVQPPRG